MPGTDALPPGRQRLGNRLRLTKLRERTVGGVVRTGRAAYDHRGLFLEVVAWT
jgi:hypothetical protein